MDDRLVVDQVTVTFFFILEQFLLNEFGVTLVVLVMRRALNVVGIVYCGRVDGQGKRLVADTNNHRIQVLFVATWFS